LARSFRAPSLEERFKYIDLGNYVRLGDPSLNPEKGYSADLGIRIWSPRLCLQSGVFLNRITNMIVEAPGEFVYTLTSESEPDTIPALINSNVSKALLYGFDFKLDYNVYDNLVLFVSGAYVRGKNTDANKNLPLVPPLNGRLGIRYSNYKAGAVELTLVGAAKQNKIAEGEKETDGYYRLDMAVNTNKIDLGIARLQVFAGIDNITNNSYTNHLSTNRGDISIEPGRNIFLRLNLSF
jgi:hemoglobin/transferrin/lactoferrin receptor protein